MNKNKYIKKVFLSSSIDKNSYLNSLPVINFLQNNNELDLNNDITFFIGENGSGKSTLIEAIAIAYGFNPEGGSRNFNFSTKNSHSELWKHITLAKANFAEDGFFLRAESIYNVASNIDYMDSSLSFDPPIIESYGGVSLHNQSHGESFLSIIKNRFFGNGIYILDEPEAALSPMKILNLIIEINKLINNNSQFIIATHSPMLIAFPNATIYEFSSSGVKKVTYEETEHFQLTKSFWKIPKECLNTY